MPAIRKSFAGARRGCSGLLGSISEKTRLGWQFVAFDPLNPKRQAAAVRKPGTGSHAPAPEMNARKVREEECRQKRSCPVLPGSTGFHKLPRDVRTCLKRKQVTPRNLSDLPGTAPSAPAGTVAGVVIGWSRAASLRSSAPGLSTPTYAAYLRISTSAPLLTAASPFSRTWPATSSER